MARESPINMWSKFLKLHLRHLCRITRTLGKSLSIPVPAHRHRCSAEETANEALDWLVRLHSGTFSEQSHREFRVWLGQTPRHRKAFSEASDLWEDLGNLSHAQKASHFPIFPLRKSHWMTPSAIPAATAMLVLVIFGMSLPALVKTMRIHLADYQTGTGEHAVIQLGEGTVVHLNTGTAINVTISGTHRKVTLVEGEAHFVVAPDPHRPFTVTTHTAMAQALGTEFTIRTLKDETIVTVLHHAVAVFQPATPQSTASSRTLRANQQARVTPEGGIEPVKTINPTMAKAWQRGKLIFEEKPLVQVIAELNRYQSGAILVMNPQLDALKVTGVFDLTDTTAILQTIQKILPVSTLSITPYLTLLF